MLSYGKSASTTPVRMASVCLSTAKEEVQLEHTCPRTPVMIASVCPEPFS